MNIKKRCSKSGCRVLIDSTDRYCEAHTNDDYKQYNKIRRRDDETREYIDFYSNKPWRNVRYQRLLIDKFLCQRCLNDKGLYTKAVMVHHCYAHKDYPEERLNIETIISLCNSCHNSIESSREAKYVWEK